MDTPKRVLVLDTSPDLLELNRILLTAEGYDVVTSGYEGADLALIRGHHPHVVLFDLVKDRAEPWTLLTQLAGDPELRDVGVMVTSAAPGLIEKAVNDPSLHVTSGLLMPFDIDDLYARLEEAIHHAQATGPAGTVTVAVNPAIQAAAQTLGSERRNIVFRWVQRVSTLEAYRGRRDLTLTEVLGEMGSLLDALVEGLQGGTETVLTPANTELGGQLARHVALRRTQGITPAELVQEYGVLRSEINRALRGALHLWRLGLADVLLAQERVDEGIDSLIVGSLEALARAGMAATPAS